MKQVIFVFASLIILASCHANYDKAHSGLVYKIFPGKGGMKLSEAKFVKLNIEYTIKRKGKDSILNSSFGKVPQYNPIDTGAQVAYSYMEILPKCRVGDSVEFTLSVDTLRKRNVNLPMEIFHKGDFIKGKLKILNAFTTREAIMADINKEQEKEGQKEITAIDKYVAKNHFTNVKKSPNGVYIMIDHPGDGVKMDTGKVAMVLYRGYYITNGEVFDTNMDDSKGHASKEGYPVTIGGQGVIQGWLEALPFFTKGAKGKIIVPSKLGYGPQAYNGIPGGSTLVFDIEIADVKAAAPQQQQQPGAQPAQQ